jgi:teichuronic acid biosynthesis glycosyltransferase TuaC
VPRAETRGGVAVVHPRFPVIPKIGRNLTPGFMVRACRRAFREIVAREKIDLIDAHYFYPDGVAAARLAAEIGIPCVITGRGTDLNVFPDFPGPRRMIVDAARSASACITVSGALRRRLIEIGGPADRIVTLRNGVDAELFYPEDREAARRRIGVSGPCLVSVGNIVPEKGQGLIVEALPSLPDATLVLVGDGAGAAAVKERAAALGVADRVVFSGRVPQSDLRHYFSAADVSVLASAREGWPNVLLESMACGTPVVATDVGGVREIVTAPEAGVVVEERSATALAVAITRVLGNPPERAATRKYAEGFGWEATSRGQIDLFRKVLYGQMA